MKGKRKLVLVGDSVFAEVAYEYFNYDSAYEVVAFSVEHEFLKRQALFNLPIVSFEELGQLYPPAQHDVFVAIVFTQFNRLRTRLYQKCKAKGYAMASYISSHAAIRPESKIGEHCFICEDNVIQPFAAVDNNVIIWSGTQIGHRALIEDNCFILPNCVISDGVVIGQNSIISANATVISDIRIGHNCFVGPAMLVTEDVPDNQVLERIPSGTYPILPAGDC